MKINTSNRIFGLDVMRAIAILLVLCSHTSLLMYPETKSAVLSVIRFFGAIGVDVFFVLSGFLIGGILLRQINKGKTSPKDMLYFLVRRWLRTLPNYYLILLINILLIYTVNKTTINGIGPFFLFLQNFATGQIDFFTESWSLSIEEYAYIIGPLLLLLFFALFKKRNKITLLLWVTLVIIIVISCLRLLFHFNETVPDYTFWSQNLRKVVIYRIDSIYYGFIAAFLAFKYKQSWKSSRFNSLVVGCIMFFGMHGLMFFYDMLPENAPLFYNLFYLPLVSLSIAMFLPFLSTWQDSRFFEQSITRISLWSYSLYLVNYSIVLLTIKNHYDVAAMEVAYKVLTAALFLGISFLLSYVLFRWFERPMMNLRDSPYIKNKFN